MLIATGTSPADDPLHKAEVSLPDGLVLDERTLVTDTATITGTAVLPRGAVLGQMNDGRYRLAVASATDGSNVPCAILANISDVTSGDVEGGVYLGGSVHVACLTFDPSITPLNAQAALRRYGIFVKGLPATL
ncbi:head decoration protein [Bradyrhizobium sp. Pha-3]|uniref:head decoration protein n=1 Tax=Bradyrhizobium sp. Pha-3 TaxID=208375 RepID=UPI0035D3DDBA